MNEAGSDVFARWLNQLIDLATHDLAGTHVDADLVLIREGKKVREGAQQSNNRMKQDIW